MEAPHPAAKILVPLEEAAFSEGRAPYASLYKELGKQLKPLGASQAYSALPYLQFITPQFTGFQAKLRLSSAVHALADEHAYQQGSEKFRRLSKTLPFKPNFIKVADDRWHGRPVCAHKFRAAGATTEKQDNEEALLLAVAAAWLYLKKRNIPGLLKPNFDLLLAYEEAQSALAAVAVEETIRGIIAPLLAECLAGERSYDDLLASLISPEKVWGIPGKLSPQAHMEIAYRTATATAYTQARVDYGMNPELAAGLPGGQLLVTLDERTSDICRPLAGLYVPRELILSGRCVPPFHFNCRTVFVWVSVLDWNAELPVMDGNYWASTGPKATIQPGFGRFSSALWNI
jgi:hypothetical protein